MQQTNMLLKHSVVDFKDRKLILNLHESRKLYGKGVKLKKRKETE